MPDLTPSWEPHQLLVSRSNWCAIIPSTHWLQRPQLTRMATSFSKHQRRSPAMAHTSARCHWSHHH
uniref:Uncharacterized protein n=1 Tax=Rhizophora mucronata TaxID=61149 RepID=A0A2P2NJJ9_RHIMU